MAPTRELALQLYHEALVYIGSNEKLRIRPKYLKKTIIPKTPEAVKEFVRTTDLLISTPQKLAAALESFNLGLQSVKYLVIDEADKLFETEAIPQTDKIITFLNEHTSGVHKSIFSATMQPNVENLVASVLVDHVKVLVGIKNATVQTVDQKLVYVGNEQGKLLALRQKFKEGFKPPMLVFVQSKQRAKELYSELLYDGIKIGLIHADMKLKERDEMIEKFRRGEVWVLICSDLLARGIDFKGVNIVVNYDFPQSIVSYIHRIGRAGRAGNKGSAITFVTTEDVELLKPVANLMKKSGCDVPEWMLKLKAPDRKRKKELEKHPVRRKRITTEVTAHVDKGYQKKLKNLQKQMDKAKRKKTDEEDDGFQIAGDDQYLDEVGEEDEDLE